MKSKKDFYWNILGSTMYGFSSMLLIVGVNFICGASVSGMFSVTFVTAQMLMYLGNYGVRVYQASDISEKYSFSNYLYHRMLTCMMMMIAGIAFVWMRGYNNEMTAIVIAVTAYKMLDAFSDCFEGRLQQNDMFYLSGKSLFYRTLISSLSLLICLYITKNLLCSCIITVFIAIILCIVFSVCPTIKYSSISVEEMQLKKSTLGLFPECFPLFSSLFMLAYIVNSPKYAIENNLPYEMQTYFNAFYFPAQVIYLITSFAFKPLIFSMAQYWNDKDAHYKIKGLINKLIFGILVFMPGAVAVAFFIGIPILNILFQLNFSDYRVEMIIMLIGGAGIAIVNMIYNALTVMRCKKCIFISYAFVFIISIILPNIFVKRFNLLGAILSYDILMYALAAILLYFFYTYIKK